MSDDTLDDLIDDLSSTGDDIFEDAARRARSRPDKIEVWDQLEGYAADEQKPDAVASLYREILGRNLTPDVATVLSERAVNFHEEWYGEDSPLLADVLGRVLELDPSNDWAFQRLTVAHTVAERWEPLLDLYAAMVERTRNTSRKEELLEEAAQTAKDFAHRPDRAVDFLMALAELRPADRALADNIERLLERLAEWQKLIGFLRGRMRQLGDAEAHEVRARIAEVWLDHVRDHAKAVTELRAVLSDPNAEVDRPVEILRRIVDDQNAPATVRGEAAVLLRGRFAAEDRVTDIVRALDAEISFADDYQKIVLHREAASHLQEQGKLDEAFEHWVEVVLLSPTDEAREKLAQLAEQTGNQTRRIAVLLSTASVTDQPTSILLRLESAAAKRELKDAEGAIELYASVLATEGLDRETSLECASQLATLYGASSRRPEQLGALERVAELVEGGRRRQALQEVAKLAAGIGEIDRAVAAWEQRLKADPEDEEALGELIDLLDRKERWAPLVGTLERRLTIPSSPWQRRQDLVRIARTQAERLRELDAAIDSWKKVAEEFGENPEIVDALAALYAEQSRWKEYEDVLGRAATREDAHLETVRVRLGDAFREHLDEPAAAVDQYRRALEAEPRSEGARAGLLALGEIEAVAPTALEALARSYRDTDDWQALVSVLDQRLASAPDDAACLRMLEEAAELYEARGNDTAAALDACCRALKLQPANPRYERELLRLAEVTGDYAKAVDGVSAAAARTDDVLRTAELRGLEQRLREEHLSDKPGALTASIAALNATPRNLELGQSVARLAEETSTYDAAESALTAATEGVATTEMLELLVAMRRPAGGRALFQALMRVAEQEPARLGELYEASEIALQLGDEPLALSSLQETFTRASAAWRRGDEGEVLHAPDAVTSWALDKLLELHSRAARFEDEMELLVLAARLPFEADHRLQMRRRAAAIANEKLGDAGRAMELYRDVLETEPEDLDALAKLADLYEAAGRWPELLGIRQRELTLTTAEAHRLELRLKIVSLIDRIDGDGGRVDSLRRNLVERPGHPPTIEELERVYVLNGRYADLADMLGEQATQVSGDLAVRLWSRLGVVAEEKLQDQERSIEAYRRYAELSGAKEAFDALARIHGARSEYAAASKWLAKRLEIATSVEKTALSLALARSLGASGKAERAVQVLEEARVREPGNEEIRELLRGHYERMRAYESLARVLADAAVHTADRAMSLALVHEAAALYRDRLGTPAESLAVLRRGLDMAPDDQELRAMLAEAYENAGELAEARKLLVELVESFGRRRSADRAQAHMRLAKVLQAQGDLNAALEELETATKMARASETALQRLGRLARKAGDLDRAEKAYRTLLMTVRRKPGESEVGVAEVLYELSSLATLRNESDQATDLFDSAVEAASQDDLECQRLVASLVDHEEPTRAVVPLERRLQYAEQPSSKAKALASFAEILDRHMSQPDEAFDKRLQAVEADPSTEALLQDTLELARRVGAVDRYLQVLDDVIAHHRRGDDASLVARLLVHQGEIVEDDVGDSERATELFRSAERTGYGPVHAWQALARLASRRGDRVEEERVLRLLSDSRDADDDVRLDARYRLGELMLGQSDTRDEGVNLLREALALESPRYEQVGPILASAAKRDPAHDGVMRLLEEVARSSGDDDLLLSFLEYRSLRADVTLEQLREGSDRALALSAMDRAERILKRAVDLAKANGSLTEARWALRALAERREAVGDVAGSIAWLEALAEQTEDEKEVYELRLKMAKAASQTGGDHEAAARAYEQLLEIDSLDREVWLPLLGVYSAMGDEEKLNAEVGRLVDALIDPEERNVARMEKAYFLLKKDDRTSDAADVLRAVLDEEPTHQVAGSLLRELFEKAGYSEELVELLERQRDVACDEEDVAQIVAISLKLAGILQEVRRDDAMDVFRRALDWAPNDRSLIEAFLALFTDDDDQRERLELRERLLASMTGEEATALALELHDAWQALEDDESMYRVLMAGYQANPYNDDVRERLEARLREREDWAGMASFLETEAKRMANDPPAALHRILESAAIRRDRLSDADGAVEVLRRARESFQDVAILRELVLSLEALGRTADAAAEVGAALDSGDPASPDRPELLRLRARLNLSDGNLDAAIGDLEEAYQRLPTEVGAELIDALQQRRQSVSIAGDADGERRDCLRLVAVLMETGQNETGRDLLVDWVRSHSDDVEALVQLRDLDVSTGNWAGVAEVCGYLVQMTAGEDQIETALLLADAAAAAGDPAAAQGALEHVVALQPAESIVVEKLAALYEQMGAYFELANLLMAQAEEADPEVRFELFRRAGRFYVEVGDSESAFAALQAAARINPGDHETAITLVDAYLSSERYAEAGELLEQAIGSHTKRRSPELSELQHRMARLAAAAGDRHLEMQWLGAALDSDKNNVIVAGELAELAIELNELEVAMNALRAVTLSKADGPMSRAMAFLWQAKIAYSQGEERRALLWARKARSEDPDLQDAADFLAQLGDQ